MKDPLSGHFSSDAPAWPNLSFPAMKDSSYSRLLDRLAVVPRHPLGGLSRQFLSVPLQLGKIVERVGAAQLAGGNQAHEQGAHLRPVQGSVEQCVLPVKNGPLQCPFHDVVFLWFPRRTGKRRQRTPVP